MNKSNIWQKIALLDVEASGLMPGSFPVEVSWSFDGARRDILIDPSKHWDTLKWDVDAEAIHNLSLHNVTSKGRPPAVVASQLNKAFAPGVLVFTDSPEYDLAWLDMLHNAAGIKRSYRVESIGRLLAYLGVSANRSYEIFDKARAVSPPRGRARNGVNFLNTVVEQAIIEVSNEII